MDNLKRYSGQYSVSANNYGTFDIDLSASQSSYRIVAGYAIESASDVLLTQLYFSSSTTLHARFRNISNTNKSFTLVVLYL